MNKFQEWKKEVAEDFDYWLHKHTFVPDDKPELHKFTWKKFFVACWWSFYGWNPIYNIRMLAQKIFRKNHLADCDIWETSHSMAKECLKRLRAFKKYDRHGYPSAYCSAEDYGLPIDQYNSMVLSGEVEGGGPERWEQALDRMIMALEYIAYVADGWDEPPIKEWWDKWFGFSPNDERDVNAYSYWIPKDKYKKDGLNFNGLRTKPEDVENYVEDVHYHNMELEQYAGDVVNENMMLLARNWMALWD